MSLSDKLYVELKRLAGFSASAPNTVSLNGPDQLVVEIDFTVVDTMSSSLREIRLNVPSLSEAGFDTLRQWAGELCSRVTYLLENIGPLELDPESGQVLIRSTPPGQQSGDASFYEILLKSHGDGNFSLRRYTTSDSTEPRLQVDMQTTHELLGKLLDDLVESIPDAAA